MKEITVIGSCVCRDLFEKDNGKNYSFQTDIRFSSPISMLSKSIEFVRAEEKHFENKVDVVGTNWYKKNLINDINKTAFEALKKRHGEYLVLDLAESRLSLANLKWNNHTQSLLVTNSVSFRGHYKNNLSKNIFKNTSFDVISPLSFSDDYWRDTIKAFVERLEEIFEEDKIILIKTKPARHYIDLNGILHPYSTPNHFNEILLCDFLLEKLNSFFLEFCPRCHVVDFPSDAVGSQKHKWGNHPFHYTEIYYEYLLKCMNSIVLENSDSEPECIYTKYLKIFHNERDSCAFKSANSIGLSNKIDYIELLDRYEEFKSLGKKRKMQILFALDKRHFLKHASDIVKGRK